jgi:hypothetical protein
MILSKTHEGVAGGHYAGKSTAEKILCVDFGGPPFIRMLRSSVKLVMSVSELGSLSEEMRCL